mgnify:CR=1 FL=1
MQPASEKQNKMFFALGHSLGYEPDVIKEAGKKQFGVAHLRELTSEQMGTLIDKLLIVQDKEKNYDSMGTRTRKRIERDY